MKQQSMKKYDEIETKRTRPFIIVIVVLLLVFALLLGGTFYIKSKMKLPKNFKTTTSLNLDQNISKQLDNQSGESVVSIRIEEKDLSDALNVNAKDFPLKNPSVKITPDKVILSGKTSNGPLAFKVEVGIVPKVENGKVVFDIKEVKTAGVSAPKMVTDEVNKNLSGYLDNIKLSEEIIVTNIELFQGYLIVTGERKNNG